MNSRRLIPNSLRGLAIVSNVQADSTGGHRDMDNSRCATGLTAVRDVRLRHSTAVPAVTNSEDNPNSRPSLGRKGAGSRHTPFESREPIRAG